jgi:predicted ribosomally synthesized peptide with nif11-like leader
VSIAEAERFIKDLAGDPALRDTVKAGGGSLGALVDVANKHGYLFTIDEAKQYIRSQSNQPLSDEQLDALAGGSSPAATVDTVVLSGPSTTQVVEVVVVVQPTAAQVQSLAVAQNMSSAVATVA